MHTHKILYLVMIILIPKNMDAAKNDPKDYVELLKELGEPSDSLYDTVCENIIPFEKFTTPTEFLEHSKYKKLRQIVSDEIDPYDDDLKPTTLFKQLYQSCRDEKEFIVEDLKEELYEVGKWPWMSVTTEFENTDYFWINNMVDLKIHGFPYDHFISIHIHQNSEKPTEYAITLDEGIFPWKTLNIEVEAYNKLMTQLLEEIGYGNRKTALDELEDVSRFQIELSMISQLSESEQTDGRGTFQMYQNDKLTDLEILIVQLAKPHNIKKLTEVNVTNISYLKKLFELLLMYDTNSRVLANFTFISTIAKMLNMTEINRKFSKENQCVITVENKLRNVVTYSYIREEMKDSTTTVNEASQIAEQVRQEFISQLNTISWLKKVTKKTMVNKISDMKIVMGYQESVTDLDAVVDYYTEMPILFVTRFVRNVLNINKFHENKKWKKLADSDDVNKMDNFYNDDNFQNIFPSARYDRFQNVLVYDIAFLRPPLFDATFPDYENFATTGTLLARVYALTLFRDVISGTSMVLQNDALFRKKRDCLRELEEPDLEEESVDMGMDPSLTWTIDMMAVQIAHAAYESWRQTHDENKENNQLDDKQKFWYIYAVRYCNKGIIGDPSKKKHRLDTTVNNIQEYFADFGKSDNYHALC